MASDGTEGGRAPRNRAAEQGFKWISSSPSPAEVERLVARFPEVVRVPEPMLEEEMSGWQRRAVLARSFLRWVPAEAYLREFRRAGIQGAIVPISLAHRCHIFRFEDPAASDLVLNRPWVVNGQIVGTEAWKPEFFPDADSIASALVWVRLPNLPMEFWRDDILKAIMEPTGVFFGADAATQSKNRGGYARVVVRVDLCRSLRPGTRVQGIRGPFWQQFIFESLEAICPSCGSLHLKGTCSPPAMAEGEEAACGPVFGPWMSAIRQRRSAAVPLSKPPPTASPPSSASLPVPTKSGSPEGWQVPAKVARRRLPESSINGSASLKQGGDKGESGMIAVPVFLARASFKESVKGKQKQLLNVASDHPMSQSLASSNPFASLGLVSNEWEQSKKVDAGPGPLKRARPVDSAPPRSVSKLEKRKGKTMGSNPKSRVDLIPASARSNQPSCCPVKGPRVVTVTPDRGDDHECEVFSEGSLGQGKALLSSVQLQRSGDTEGDTGAMQAFPEGGTQSIRCLSDSDMAEDQGDSPSISS